MDGWSDRLTTAPNDVWQCLRCGWIGVRVTAPAPTHCPVCGTEWDATEEADG